MKAQGVPKEIQQLLQSFRDDSMEKVCALLNTDAMGTLGRLSGVFFPEEAAVHGASWAALPEKLPRDFWPDPEADAPCFTPRNVVKFLIDNTLGRLWVEMRQGNTALGSMCWYQIRDSREVQLAPTHFSWSLKQNDWVKNVAQTADFSHLPEDPLIWDELERFVLMIDGYDAIKKIETQRQPCTGDTTQAFADRLLNPNLAELKAKGKTSWRGSSLELWCCIFLIQRFFWKEGGTVSETGDKGSRFSRCEPLLIPLWTALREKLKAEQAMKVSERQTLYIPYLATKDPRDLKMEIPECWVRRVKPYVSDMFRVIYREAWEIEGHKYEEIVRSGGLKPLRELYPDELRFLQNVPDLIAEYNLPGVDADVERIKGEDTSHSKKPSSSVRAETVKANVAERREETSVAPPHSTHLMRTKVAGTFAISGKQYVFSEMKPGNALNLRREPYNEHDSNAISIWWHGSKMGYVPRTIAEDLAPEMDDDVCIFGRVAEVDREKYGIIADLFQRELLPLDEMTGFTFTEHGGYPSWPLNKVQYSLSLRQRKFVHEVMIWREEVQRFEIVFSEKEWQHICDKLEKCNFLAWEKDYIEKEMIVCDAPYWNLALRLKGNRVFRSHGDVNTPEEWCIFQSFLDDCRDLSQIRGNGSFRVVPWAEFQKEAKKSKRS